MYSFRNIIKDTTISKKAFFTVTVVFLFADVDNHFGQKCGIRIIEDSKKYYRGASHLEL